MKIRSIKIRSKRTSMNHMSVRILLKDIEKEDEIRKEIRKATNKISRLLGKELEYEIEITDRDHIPLAE